MKKVLSMLCLAILVAFANGQTPAPSITPFPVPVDPITKLIAYEGVFDVKGVAADELYYRIIDWFQSYYKNPTEVIRENDSINHKMVGKPRYRLSNPPDKQSVRSDAGISQYTITVAAKDGRFKYELTEFTWKQQSTYPCERWLDTKATSYAPAYNDYLKQLHKTAIDVIASLKKTISEVKPVKNKDNW